MIGDYLISTVGEYLPSESAREILANSRGVVLVGRGDEREASFLTQIGYEEIGLGRKYETMVFKVDPDARCTLAECGCNAPAVSDWGGLDSDGYNTAGDATKGHMAMCERWSNGPPPDLNDD